MTRKSRFLKSATHPLQPACTAALLAALCGSPAVAANAPAAAPAAPAMPVAALQSTLSATRDQQAGGMLQFKTSAKGGVAVSGELRGLTAGAELGLHVHEKGDCSAPDAMSAGGHFNPLGKPHGGPHGEQRHAGDFGNVKADARGLARVDLVVEGLQLDGESGLLGRSVVLHARPDDLKSQPSGESGARIACGTIVRADAAPSVGMR